MKPKISVPSIGTKSARDFFASWADINKLFSFIIFLVVRADESAEGAHNALINYAQMIGDDNQKTKFETDWAQRRTAASALKENSQLFLETILVRHVENFINYLSSVLFEIFLSRPETLKSSEKIEVSKVLEHDSIDSLIREIAETKVDSLSYSSFSKLVEFFQERFNITLADESNLKIISNFIEIRNISVHNRCLINKRYISRTGISVELLGTKRLLNINDLEVLMPKLAEIVIETDHVVRRKLKVKGTKFKLEN